jgi:preprotein translocase subunit YajC
LNGGFFIVILVLLALMYFLMIRPQRARQRAQQDQLSSVEPGDEVLTIGGIYGDVVEVQDEKLVVEIAEDIHIEIARKAIGTLVKADDRLEAADVGPDEDDEPVRSTKFEIGQDDEKEKGRKKERPLSTKELAERART